METMGRRTSVSPFLTLPAFLGKTTRRALYASSLSLLSLRPSSDLFLLRWSTGMPIERASLGRMPAALSSALVKPLPARSFVL